VTRHITQEIHLHTCRHRNIIFLRNHYPYQSNCSSGKPVHCSPQHCRSVIIHKPLPQKTPFKGPKQKESPWVPSPDCVRVAARSPTHSAQTIVGSHFSPLYLSSSPVSLPFWFGCNVRMLRTVPPFSLFKYVIALPPPPQHPIPIKFIYSRSFTAFCAR
jgi:hypothetical protein